MEEGLLIEQVAHHGAEVLGIGADSHGAAAEAGLNHILRAVLAEALTHKDNLREAVEAHQLARGVGQEDGIFGLGRGHGGTALAQTGEAGGGDIALHLAGLLEVAGGENEAQSGHFGARPAVDFQQEGVLARPGGAAQEDGGGGVEAGGEEVVAQLGLLGGIAAGDIELHRAADLDAPALAAGIDQPLGVELGLRIDAREAVEDGAEPALQAAVAGGAAVGDTRVDQEDWHLARGGQANDIGPELGLSDHIGRRADGLHGAADAAGVVKRTVDEHVVLLDLRLGLGPARAAGHREDEGDAGGLAAHLGHQLPGHGHLAHRDRVHPHPAPTVPQPRANSLGVDPKTVAEAVGIAPAPAHPKEELGHHQHIGNGKEQVID